MRKTMGAARRKNRKEDLVDALQSFLKEVDAVVAEDATEVHTEWWNEVSSVLRAGLGQDPQVSRGFESARSTFYRSRGADGRRGALLDLKSTMERALARLESMSWDG